VPLVQCGRTAMVGSDPDRAATSSTDLASFLTRLDSGRVASAIAAFITHAKPTPARVLAPASHANASPRHKPLAAATGGMPRPSAQHRASRTNGRPAAIRSRRGLPLFESWA
jgi:hypothetical protein